MKKITSKGLFVFVGLSILLVLGIIIANNYHIENSQTSAAGDTSVTQSSRNSSMNSTQSSTNSSMNSTPSSRHHSANSSPSSSNPSMKSTQSSTNSPINSTQSNRAPSKGSIPLVTHHDGHYVYLTGAVERPGLYELEDQVTMAELVKAAGGLLPYADAQSIDLGAEAKVDEHIHIPFDFKGSPEELTRKPLINMNLASEEELIKLPGIGPSMAKKILAYREEHGSFTKLEDLRNIKGLGPSLLHKIKDKISL